jgi:hypothetical protein
MPVAFQGASAKNGVPRGSRIVEEGMSERGEAGTHLHS